VNFKFGVQDDGIEVPATNDKLSMPMTLSEAEGHS